MTSIAVDSFSDLKNAIEKKYSVIEIEGELAEKIKICFEYKNYIIAAFTLAGIAAGAALVASTKSTKAFEILKFAARTSGESKGFDILIRFFETIVVHLSVITVISMLMDYEFEAHLEIDPKTGKCVMKYKLKRNKDK